MFLKLGGRNLCGSGLGKAKSEDCVTSRVIENGIRGRLRKKMYILKIYAALNLGAPKGIL